MMKIGVFTVAAFAATAVSSVALARDGVTFSPDHRVAYASPNGAAHFTPNLIRKPAQSTIYSNLALAYPKGIYFSQEGSTVFANSQGSQFVASGFTPSAKASAVEVDVAVGGYSTTPNAFTVSIYSDAGGVPGTSLASAVGSTTSPFGDCCGLLAAKFKGGVALQQATPYWIVVSLNKKQIAAGSEGAWGLATVDQVDLQPFAVNDNNTGWQSLSFYTPPAFAVYSK